jgi:nucleotide-binding universal stress UspA family protein
MEPHAAPPPVVVGFDGSEGSRRALEWAAAECELRHCALVVVHADRWAPVTLELPAFQDEERTEERILEEGIELAKNGRPALDVRGLRAPPPAGESLIEAARGASLLVVGSRGLRHLEQMVIGSVSRYCVDHAHCPVVVVRPPEAPAAPEAREGPEERPPDLPDVQRHA